MQSRLIHMGQRLKQILKQKKIKIVDFAYMAGFTNQIAHYHLRKSDMKRSTLEKFCNLIGITTEEFYDWNSTVLVNKGDTVTIHHGQRLSSIIAEKGLNKSRLAKRLDMSRRTMYNLFEKEVFAPEELLLVVNALEMTQENFLNPGLFDEPKRVDHDELLAAREKYYKLLEEHNQLLKNHAALKDALEMVKKDVATLRKQLRSKK